MISFITSNKMTDRPVFAMRPLGIEAGISAAPSFGSVQGTGLSLAKLPIFESALGNERPTKAPEVAETAVVARVRAIAAETDGAGSRAKQYQHHTMWAFRGLEPWRDPA
ncbi:hypothetical protein [Streptomyces huiliensis]|uniref:hypothetical protein n=1 Tax=Streptomyces huiliensis TaxID=2876027 RepID=UPI001CBC1F28|nr:hypothetical protein [Streptomyces huiliensis]MBZ4322319.1 hypothetical protein [Streptomyces huiliensis]